MTDKLIDLIEGWSPYLASDGRGAFFTSGGQGSVMYDLIKMCVVRWPFCWAAFCMV